MVGQALMLLPMSSASCRALSTACGLALASLALKLIGSPVCFSAASFALQTRHRSELKFKPDRSHGDASQKLQSCSNADMAAARIC